MGKHLISREERIREARAWRKHMNKRHHLEAKQDRERELQILKQMRLKTVSFR